MSTQQTQTSGGQAVRTVNVRGGKPYVEVAERVRLAHSSGKPFTMVASEPYTLDGTGRWWQRVTIIVDGQQFIGTAEIKFDAKPGTADHDAPMECAETSALGRALGFAGIGLLDSIASADEVNRADQRRQSQPQPTQTAQQAQATAEPTPIHKRSWAHLRLRALQAGLATEEQWADVVCQITGKNDARAMTHADYDMVEQAIVAIEQAS